VGSRQNGNPKKDLRLPFSLVRFFWASKRNEQINIGAKPHFYGMNYNRANGTDYKSSQAEQTRRNHKLYILYLVPCTTLSFQTISLHSFEN
jgi:hypothetical protein